MPFRQRNEAQNVDCGVQVSSACRACVDEGLRETRDFENELLRDV
ncbi:MAG: hypothetical protein RJA70_321 [Pseudomonadota bacterium]|jgi:hypothetical protein